MKIFHATHTLTKRMLIKLTLLASVFMVISPSEATALEKPLVDKTQAQPREPGHRPDKAGKGWKRGKDERRGRGPNFKALDSNGDGFLSFEEFSTSERLARIEEEKRRRLFNFLDRNKDGKLQQKELQTRDHSWLTSMHKDFNRLDINKDGVLDMAEFSQAKEMAKKNEASRMSLFKRLDRNKDGSIQREELRAPGRSRSRHDLDFKKYDTNSSGGLDFAEFSKLPFVGRLPDDRRKQHFERIDTDQNGEISPDETRAAHKHRPRSARGKNATPPEPPQQVRPGHAKE